MTGIDGTDQQWLERYLSKWPFFASQTAISVVDLQVPAKRYARSLGFPPGKSDCDKLGFQAA